jgi:hypothetical protein
MIMENGEILDRRPCLPVPAGKHITTGAGAVSGATGVQEHEIAERAAAAGRP